MLKFLTVVLALLFCSDVYAQTFYGWRYREHATDCTSLTDGKTRDLCYELDSDTLYKCEPTAGDCDTAGEWRVVNYGPGGTDVPVADGGTGASTAADARTNLGLVIGTDVLAPNGDGSGLSGVGDVVGPASATDNAIARFDSTTGKLIQNTPVTISDTGSITFTDTSNTKVLQPSTVGSGVGVAVTVQGGTGVTTGGNLKLQAGHAGTTSTGGEVQVYGGNGGSTSGNGGRAVILGGSALTSGAGGAVNIQSGSAAGTNQAGGNINFILGEPTGSGTVPSFWFYAPGASYAAKLDAGSISGSSKTFTFPNTTGTFALTSDLHDAVTVTDSAEIDFTLSTQDLTAVLKAASVGSAKINWSDIDSAELQRAGINWDSFWIDSATGINWGAIPGAVNGYVLKKTSSGINWQADLTGGGGGSWGSITGTLSDQTDLQTALDAKLALATYDAHTILQATSDNTPVALTVGEQTVVGRATGGNITALSIDSDLSSVSANDDTLPSAKATKAYADLMLPLAGGTMTGNLVLSGDAGEGLSGGGLTDCDNATTSKLLWDATTNKFSCGTDQTGAGGGDEVSIDGVAVTNPDFVSTGQIDFVDTSNTVTANINDNSILEADLKAVDTASDEDILTYESTTGDFEWHTMDQMIALMSEGALPNDSILEADLKAVDSPADEECLTYETTTGDFEWQACGSGSDTNSVKEYFWPASALLPVEPNDGIAPITKTANTNVDTLSVSYNDSADECRTAHIQVPSDVQSGSTITFRWKWFSLTATSGNVVWDVRYQSTGAEGESIDGSTTIKAAASDAVQGTVKLRTTTTATETLATLGWAASDDIALLVCRDGNGTNGTDDMAGDAELYSFSVEIPRA